MIKSIKLSHLFLRIGLAAVFLWFGVDKFFHPDYWISAWTPMWIVDFVARFGINSTSLAYLFGIFELLVGISLITTVFIRIFSFLSIIFLALIIVFFGFNEVIIRDIGLIGGFLAILFWPVNNGHNYY